MTLGADLFPPHTCADMDSYTKTCSVVLPLHIPIFRTPDTAFLRLGVGTISPLTLSAPILPSVIRFPETKGERPPREPYLIPPAQLCRSEATEGPLRPSFHPGLGGTPPPALPMRNLLSVCNWSPPSPSELSPQHQSPKWLHYFLVNKSFLLLPHLALIGSSL